MGQLQATSYELAVPRAAFFIIKLNYKQYKYLKFIPLSAMRAMQ